MWMDVALGDWKGAMRSRWMSWAVLGLLLSLGLAAGTRAMAGEDEAAQQPAGAGSGTESKPATGAKQDESTSAPNDAAKKDEEEKKKHRGAIIVAPLPIVSPALGTGVIPVLGYIFPFQEKSGGSQPSVVGAAGLITDNGTRGWALGADMYFKEGQYELKSAFLRGNLNYNLYGVGYANGQADIKVPLEQTGEVFFVDFLREIKWKFYAGARFMTGNSTVTLRNPDQTTGPIPPDIGLNTNLRSLGFEILRDSRANRFYPRGGSLVDFTSDFFAQSLGSKYSFQSYRFTYNKYWSLGEKQVIAYNGYFCGTGGQPPFYGNCAYGTNNELRGYEAGRYLDRYMFATQVEYRLQLKWRLGLVGFGGVGAVAPGMDGFRSDQLLPAGGTGIRFLLARKYHVNLRTDFAWGKDSFTWSMGVGEAF